MPVQQRDNNVLKKEFATREALPSPNAATLPQLSSVNQQTNIPFNPSSQIHHLSLQNSYSQPQQTHVPELGSTITTAPQSLSLQTQQAPSSVPGSQPISQTAYTNTLPSDSSPFYPPSGDATFYAPLTPNCPVDGRSPISHYGGAFHSLPGEIYNYGPQVRASAPFPPQMGPPQVQGLSGPHPPFYPQSQMPAGAPGDLGPPSNKLDPSQVPSPVLQMRKDQEVLDSKERIYGTLAICQVDSPFPLPFASSEFQVQDEGNCSPRFMRVTINYLPNTPELFNTSKLPLAAIIRPLADLQNGEAEVPKVNCGANGPVRCSRCLAYVNPFMQFIEGGRKFVCNLCNHSNEVPEEYFCNLDHTGRRRDLASRHELLFGTVEFHVTSKYYNREPKPIRYLICIDASMSSLQSGMLHCVSNAILNVLDNLPKPEGSATSPIHIGIMTYNYNLQFYNLMSTLTQPQMMVVPDLSDIFVPLQTNLFVDVNESRSLLVQLLESLPTIFQEKRNIQNIDACIGVAAKGALEALKDHGGKAFIFQMSLPTRDILGKLSVRNDSGSDIFQGKSPFYKTLGKEMCQSGVSVDLFLFPSQYIDIASLSDLTSQTNGQLYLFENFNANFHGRRLVNEVRMAVTRNIGFEALLRVRCSTGLRAATFEGNIVLSGNNDVELAAVDSSRTLLCGMLYDNSFPAGSSFAYIQTALLYTTRFGERLVRVFNLRLPVVTTLFNVFKGADLDCIMNYYLRCAAKELKKNAEVKEKKEKILYHCAELLSVYRKNCASNKPSAQLILPDSLKLFPVYTCSLWKNELLRAGHVKSDRRAFLIHEVLSMPVELSIPFIYPTLVCLLDDFPEGSISPALACTAESIKPDSAYLFENGFEMFLFIGPQCPSSFYLEVFGFDNPKAINFDLSDIPVLENQLNKKLRNLVDLLRHRRRRYMSLTIATAASKNENLLQYYLVEDKGENSRSYHDTLRYIHSKIRALLQ